MKHECTIEENKEEENPIWVSQDETEFWCLCQITDPHLLNIIRFLENKEISISYPYGIHGEAAQYHLEQKFDEITERLYTSIGYFKDEANRRGLKLHGRDK